MSTTMREKREARNRRFEEYVSSIMTMEERVRLLDDYSAARKRGDYEKASVIAAGLPLPPYLADYVKERFTPEEIEEAGFDLSACEI